MEIKYKGKTYKVEEPTIEVWSKLVLMQDWVDEREFSINLLSMITGLSIEDVENADALEIMNATQELSKFFLTTNKEFKNEIEFKDKKYRFIDLPNLTFGEFIDVDTFLSKTPTEKKKEMHFLMAMLYREVNEDGTLQPYDSKKIPERAELFKKLPVKYVHGATSFFLRLEQILQGRLQTSLRHRMRMTMKVIYLYVKFKILISFGLGLGRLFLWLTRISPKYRKLHNIR